MKTVLTTHDKELIMLLPSFMALHIEHKLSEICRKGYRLVEISNAIIGYRFRFSCASPQNRAFYVFAANEHRAAKAGIENAIMTSITATMLKIALSLVFFTRSTPFFYSL